MPDLIKLDSPADQDQAEDMLFACVIFGSAQDMRRLVVHVARSRPERLNAWGLDQITLRDVTAWVLYLETVAGSVHDLERVLVRIPRWLVEPREVMDLAAAPLVMSTGEQVPITRAFPSVLESLTAGLDIDWTVACLRGRVLGWS